MNKKDEILAVLDKDVSEDEQWNWLYKNKHLPNVSLMANTTRGQILADLAFRKRDEVGILDFIEAGNEVFAHVYKRQPYDDGEITYWLLQAKPIHWILAALIVKTEVE